LRELFKENVTVIGNAEINDTFNDDYASKLIIGIDEAIFEKQQVVERLKSWVTSSRIKMNTKFMARQEIPFLANLLLPVTMKIALLELTMTKHVFGLIKCQ